MIMMRNKDVSVNVFLSGSMLQSIMKMLYINVIRLRIQKPIPAPSHTQKNTLPRTHINDVDAQF